MVTSDTLSLRKSYIVWEYSMYSVAQCIYLEMLPFKKLFIHPTYGSYVLMNTSPVPSSMFAKSGIYKLRFM